MHPSFSSEYLAAVGDTVENSLSKTFQISEGDLGHFFVRIITVPILGVLIVAALKRTFEKKFRRK